MVNPTHMTSEVIIQRANRSRVITLNRPTQLNSVTTSLLVRLLGYLKTCETSKEINLVILKGAGRAFCTGGDLKHCSEAFVDAPDPYTATCNLQGFSQIYALLHLIATMNTPVVTLMDGITCGAGSGIGAFSQFRIATENTCVAMPEATIGTFCDMGSSYYMSRLDANLGTYLALTGRLLKGEDVYLAGFATHFVPSSSLKALEERLTQITEPTLDLINDVIEEYAVGPSHKPSSYTMHGQRLEKISEWFRYDTVEEIIDALRRDGSKFALDTMNTILSNSPTCLKITLESYRRGRTMSLLECLDMECRIWHISPYLPDFKNGIRAKLITKQKIEWNPSRLEDVDLEEDIRSRIFHCYAPIIFVPSSRKDYFKRPVNYTLPTEREILDALLTYELDSVEKVIEWCQATCKGKKYGVVEKVTDVLNRNRSRFNKLVAKL
ncbi:ClpP/crotonase [Rhizopus microsporus]|uniref:3-hydroxyisobutyryl-CoA hydrolase n=1 Tax=Rhizopus microsporus TaxID=58291 RepID=A0A1X0SE00_RHIZD|nr:ClpP/crotonase [Rhizopus microsporus]